MFVFSWEIMLNHVKSSVFSKWNYDDFTWRYMTRHCILPLGWFKWSVSFDFGAWPWPSRGHPHQNAQGWPTKNIYFEIYPRFNDHKWSESITFYLFKYSWSKILTCLDRTVKVFSYLLLSIKLNGSIVPNGFEPF